MVSEPVIGVKVSCGGSIKVTVPETSQPSASVMVNE